MARFCSKARKNTTLETLTCTHSQEDKAGDQHYLKINYASLSLGVNMSCSHVVFTQTLCYTKEY